MPDLSEVINWLIVGAIAGGLVGMLLTGRREGYGWLKNLGLGLLGGIVGGFIFIKLIKMDFGLDIQVTLEEVVAAIFGTLIVWIVFKMLKKKPKPAA